MTTSKATRQPQNEGTAIEGRRAIGSYGDMRDRTVWDCCGPRYRVKFPVRELRKLHRRLHRRSGAA
jgi:hypothetical protein